MKEKKPKKKIQTHNRSRKRRNNKRNKNKTIARVQRFKMGSTATPMKMEAHKMCYSQF